MTMERRCRCCCVLHYCRYYKRIRYLTTRSRGEAVTRPAQRADERVPSLLTARQMAAYYSDRAPVCW